MTQNETLKPLFQDQILTAEDQVDSPLLDLLIDTDLYLQNGNPFPQHIDLSWCTPTFQNLRNTSVLAEQLSQEQQQTILEELRTQEPFKNLFSDQEIQTLIIPDLALQTQAERLQTIYLDPIDKYIKSAPIIHGTAATVESKWRPALLQNNKVTIMDAHTHHPRSSFFSKKDFTPLIAQMDYAQQDGTVARVRTLSCIVVLCSNITLLALPTLETPLMPGRDALEYPNTWYQNFNNHLLDQELQDFLTQQKAQEEAEKQLMIDYSDIFKEVLRTFLSQPQDPNLEPSKPLRVFMEKIGSPAEETYNESLRLEIQEVYLKNRLLMDYANFLHVQLYASYDDANFSVFTA